MSTTIHDFTFHYASTGVGGGSRRAVFKLVIPQGTSGTFIIAATTSGALVGASFHNESAVWSVIQNLGSPTAKVQRLSHHAVPESDVLVPEEGSGEVTFSLVAHRQHVGRFRCCVSIQSSVHRDADYGQGQVPLIQILEVATNGPNESAAADRGPTSQLHEVEVLEGRGG